MKTNERLKTYLLFSIVLFMVTLAMTIGYADTDDNIIIPETTNMAHLIDIKKTDGEVKNENTVVDENIKGIISTTFEHSGSAKYTATVENVGTEDVTLSSIDLLDDSNLKEPTCIIMKMIDLPVGTILKAGSKSSFTIDITSTCEGESTKENMFKLNYIPVDSQNDTSNQSEINALTADDINLMSDTTSSTANEQIASLKQEVAALQNQASALNIKKAYPVGSIYISTSSTNPSTFFGGTWEAYAEGRTLVSVDSSNSKFNSVELTGGEKTVKFTENNMPSHSHTYSATTSTKSLKGWFGNFASQSSGVDISATGIFSASLNGSYGSYGTFKSDWNDKVTINASHNHTYSGTTAGNETLNAFGINILNPYITVYMWKRVS